jgi:hypothetical protein
MAILLSLPFFSDLRRTPPQEKTQSTGSILAYGTLYGAIGVVTFFPFLILGTALQLVIPFPQYNGLPVMSWMLGSGLIAAGTLTLLLRRRSNPQLSLRKLVSVGTERGLPDIVRLGFLTAIVFVWLYALTLMVDLGFVLDLRSFLPGLHDLTLLQAILVPLYFIVFLVYSIVEGTWFTSIMLPKSTGSWARVQLEWSATAIIIKCIPYLALIAIEFLGGLIAGAPVIPGMIGYSWLFFYAFTPWFAVCTLITMFGYRLTGNRWLGAMVNAMICAWLLASILSFR